MNQKIRRSNIEDAKYFIQIKEQLPLSTSLNHHAQGGFLLGTNLKTYQYYIQHGNCLSALSENNFVGFGIMLPNALVKKSELWEKRKEVDWSINIEQLENSNIAYLEQLAFLKGHYKLVVKLAFNIVDNAFRNGADYILTSTVMKPIENKAAIPLIRSVFGRKIGNIDEFYPEFGAINSDVHLIDRNMFYQSIKNLSSYEYLIENRI